MPPLFVKHTVEDYETWKPYFDDHAGTRKEYGERGSRLYQLADNPNEIVAMMEWDSMEGIQSFVEESDVGAVMAESGVVGEPERYILTEAE